MAKILVVTYSRTRTTARFGRELALFLEADYEQIEEVESRSGLLGYTVSALEAIAKGLPTIRTSKDPSHYDLVVVGTPVWAGNMASPVRAYLTAHRAQLRHMGFFAVMKGRGADEVLREMRFLARADDAPSCALTQSEIDGLRYASKLREFAKSLTFLAREASAPLNMAADASTWMGDVETA